MVKPDGVQRGLVGKIIQRFEQKGFKLVAMKMLWVSVGISFKCWYNFIMLVLTSHSSRIHNFQNSRECSNLAHLDKLIELLKIYQLSILDLE